MIPEGLFAGKYRLLEKVASGGTGQLFRAERMGDGLVVACKLSSEHTLEAQARFAHEARLLRALDSPGVVRCLDEGIDQQRPFLVLEWLDGISLATWLERGPLTVRETIRIVRQAAETLGIVHRAGILHGDVSPANLMLVGPERERVVLIDFGVAQSQKEAAERWGTPGYMAPEQAAGDLPIDTRADVFSLGCVLFRCLAGRGPFVGSNLAAILAKVLLEPVIPISHLRPGLDPALVELLERLLSKDPDGRPQNGAAVVHELEALDLLLQEPTPREILTRREQRARTLLLLVSEDHLQLQMALGILEPSRARLLADGKLIWLLEEREPAAAERATRAAMMLHARGCKRVVVATGRASEEHPTPEGDAIDRAMELIQVADEQSPGPLLDEATVGLLARRFSVREGSGGWWVLAEEHGLGAVLGRPSPFVGRSAEIASIEHAFGQTLSGAGPQVVLVLGETGAGKTRLAREWLGQLAGRATFWIARGDLLSAGSPFGLLGQILRRGIGLHENEPLEVRQQTLISYIKSQMEEPQSGRVSEFLGALLGLSLPGSVQLQAAREDAILMGDQMQRAFLEWLQMECRRQPLVLIIDDLQWGDLPSLRYLDAALCLKAAPLLLLALAEPEIELIFPHLWSAHKPLMLSLGPISMVEGLKIAHHVLAPSTIEEQVLKEMVERSGGHPFFLEELLRARSKKTYAEEPASVLAVLETRLSELSPEGRRVLRAASCFGRVFWAGSVAELIGGDPQASLEELIAEDLIVPRSRSRFLGEKEYFFRQALMRSAAYAMLTSEDLKLGHALAGRWLEQHGERDTAVLAEHFRRGGESARAATLFRAAAAQSLDGNDLVNVVAQAERGLLSGAQGMLAGELRLLQAEALGWQGELDSAERCAEEALALLSPGTSCWYLAVGLLASISARCERFSRLQELGMLLLTCSGTSPFEARQIAFAQIGIHLIFAGQIRFARVILQELDQPTPNAVGAAAAWRFRAFAHLATADGDLAGGLVWTERAVECYRLAGDLRNTCNQLANAGSVRNEVGCYEQAEVMLREAEGMAKSMGLRPSWAAARLNLGISLAYQGKFEEAEAIERMAIQDFEAIGHHRLHMGALVYLGRILLLQGESTKAASLARFAAERLGDAPGELCAALTVLSAARYALGDFQAALAASRAAWALLQGLGHLDEGEAALYRTHAEALLALQLQEEARLVLERGRSWILQCAASLQEEETRRNFLERCDDCVRLLSMASTIVDH